MRTVILSALFLALFTLTDSVGRTRHQPALALVLTPTIVKVPVQLHRVRAAQAGRLWETYAKSGDVVQRGQLLAKIAIPLHSMEQQQREALLQHRKQHYKSLVQLHASAAELAQARQELAQAEQLVASAPKLYSFEYVTATARGTVHSFVGRPGEYLTDSSTVALIAAPVSPEMPPGVAAH